jgi:hypothetical protein
MRALWAGGVALSGEQIERADADRRERHSVHLGPESPFGPPETRVLRWTQAMTPDEVAGLAGTYSEIITMDPSQRRGYLASIVRFIETQPVPMHQGAIEVPMRCRCWRSSLR